MPVIVQNLCTVIYCKLHNKVFHSIYSMHATISGWGPALWLYITHNLLCPSHAWTVRILFNNKQLYSPIAFQVHIKYYAYSDSITVFMITILCIIMQLHEGYAHMIPTVNQKVCMHMSNKLYELFCHTFIQARHARVLLPFIQSSLFIHSCVLESN